MRRRTFARMSHIALLQPHSANLSVAGSAACLKLTTTTLTSLNKLRRSLRLPVGQLPLLIEMYDKFATTLTAEIARAENANREPLTMRSETRDYQPMKLAPGGQHTVTARPRTSFRPEDFSIHGDRTRWRVHNILLGNRPQFAANQAPVPGTEFGHGGVCEHLRLDRTQHMMDFALVVEYVGPEPDGEVFEATVVGTVTTL